MFSASKTAAPVSGSFQVSNSLRFRSSASAYLNRTFGSGSTTAWTWSGWVKRGALGAAQSSLFFSDSTATNYAGLLFASDVLDFSNRPSAGLNARLVTTQVFRDPSAWYHIVVVWDSANATSGDRVRLYVNGARVTAFSTATYPSISTASVLNTAIAHEHGSYVAANNGTPAAFFDGYMAEVNFIDGQALTPSSFGSINATTGVWQPARYTGSYGTNGFYLKFNNGTSTTTLGNDSSGNNNNWTTNNISLTAGSTYDWMIDSPTSYAGSSYGVGNYAVLNPLANSSTLVDANLRTNGGDKWSISTIGMTSGKWYCEVAVIAVGAESSVGISSQPYSGSSPVVGGTATSWGYYSNNGNKFNNTSGPGVAYGSSYTTSDVIGIAFDADAGTLTFYKNNVSQGTAYTGLTSGPYYFAVEGRTASSANNCAANFGQRPFAYTPPTGFKSLCTQNLPAPAIYNGANHMAATLWTGTGANQNISNAVNGVSFQPDWVWAKARSNTQGHTLFDSVRGVSKYLQSNLNNAEATFTAVPSFNSDGFTSTTGVSTNGYTYVGWQWKAGGTAVSNNTGSIASQVSANTTAGFSVVTYTGTGANATVGHGLGVAPSMFIIKKRSSTSNWTVYHQSLSANGGVFLNLTDAYSADPTRFNNTAPTSTVFTLGSPFEGNTNGATLVAYCFAAIAGYSAFGSYTGNGSTDGPFLYFGFRPRFVLIKSASSAQDWYIWDSGRNPTNDGNLYALVPNSSVSESSSWPMDLVANGFKIRYTGASNNNGVTYIYAAFAENPFQNSLAR